MTPSSYRTDFQKTKAMFHLPEGIVYLDGNSLGPLPVAAQERVSRMMAEEWGRLLIRGWTDGGWMEQPVRVGDRLGKLIGAEPGSVVLGDTLSIKVYQALASALDLVPQRRIVLTDDGNFPSDLYMAQGLLDSLQRGYELRVVPPEQVANAIDETVAVVMLTEVDYRTGRKHDMASISAKARAAGALTLWDLAHSAGAISIDLTAAGADFAVGCTYKFLNGGPGAPAFIYVSPRIAESVRPALAGWLGHADPFGFEPDYRAAPGAERMRIGTPPIIALAALDAALDVWDGVDMDDVRARSIELSRLFIDEVERRCPDVTLASPRDDEQRGSQVCFRHAKAGEVIQALIARNVIGDFRPPDILRFGITPLYTDEDDVVKAATIVQDVLKAAD